MGGGTESSLVGGLLVLVFNKSGEGALDGGLPFGHALDIVISLLAGEGRD